MTLTRDASALSVNEAVVVNEAGRVDVWTDVESGSCCPRVILDSLE